MIILFFALFIIVFYILIKLILYFIVYKLEKFPFDNFSVAGFSYDPNKDLFYSTKNAWQKNFGYGYIYDVLAPIFRMIIDTETIKFNYNHKNWLISFWKGQYGIVTGAEIGIYVTEEEKVTEKTIYMPVSTEEMLDMCFILYNKDKEIMRICDKHWWLATFKLGMFNNPKKLKMDIKICFPNNEMLNSFLTAFKKLGYKDKDYEVYDCTFIFTFKKTRTHKVWTRSWLTDYIIQKLNYKNVELYNNFFKNIKDNNEIDNSKDENLIMVNGFISEILKKLPNPYPTKEDKDKYIQMINKNNVLLLKEELNPYKEK